MIFQKKYLIKIDGAGVDWVKVEFYKLQETG